MKREKKMTSLSNVQRSNMKIRACSRALVIYMIQAVNTFTSVDMVEICYDAFDLGLSSFLFKYTPNHPYRMKALLRWIDTHCPYESSTFVSLFILPMIDLYCIRPCLHDHVCRDDSLAARTRTFYFALCTSMDRVKIQRNLLYRKPVSDLSWLPDSSADILKDGPLTHLDGIVGNCAEE